MANWWVLRLACLYSDHLRTRAIYASQPNRLPLSTMFQSNDLFFSMSCMNIIQQSCHTIHAPSTLHQPAGVQGKVIPSQPPWVPMGSWPQQSPDNSTYMSPQSLANAWQPKERMEVWWDLAMTKRYQKVHVFGGNYIPWFALILRYSRPPIVHHLCALFLGHLKPNCGETNNQEWFVNNRQPPSSTLPRIETSILNSYHPNSSASPHLEVALPHQNILKPHQTYQNVQVWGNQDGATILPIPSDYFGFESHRSWWSRRKNPWSSEKTPVAKVWWKL